MDHLPISLRMLHILSFFIAIILLVAMLSWLRVDIAIDDAPITYRYAMNIISGNGFTYNPGERVLGTSTPLYTLILSGLGFLSIPPHIASPVIGILALVGTVVLSYFISEHIYRGSGFIAVLLISSSGFLAVYACSGMEISLYSFAILLAIFAYLKKKREMAFVLAGLIFLLRLDGLAVFLALSVTVIAVERRVPWRGWLLFVLVVSPWIIFATAYFGSPVPFSWFAKRTHSVPEPYWMAKFFFQDRRVIYGLLAAPIIPTLLYSSSKRWLSSAIVLPVWLGGYALAYTLAGIEQYDWYLAPVYVVMFLLAGMGLWWLTQALWRKQGIWAVPSLLIVTVLLAGLTRNASLGEVKSTRKFLENVELARKDVGVWLKNNTPQDAVIGVGFIGHIGYESHRYIYDLAGLVTPAIVAQAQGLQVPSDQRQLDYIITFDCFPDCNTYKDINDAELMLSYTIVYRSKPPKFLVLQKNLEFP